MLAQGSVTPRHPRATADYADLFNRRERKEHKDFLTANQRETR
jgi:hypothetical protein